MNSPFPGMDPYLEQHWRDVHAALVIYARDQLQPQLPADLCARVEERVCVENEDLPGRSMYPDVRVVEHGQPGAAVAVASEIELAEPLIIEVQNEPLTETFLEIRETTPDHRLITVLEFLSPTNKSGGEAEKAFRQKQQELRRAHISLVEVDLLRAGKRVLSVPARLIPSRRRTTYQAVVRRGWEWNKAEIYSLPLRAKLATLRVPLRPRDPDASLNLQSLVDQCYRNGRYHTMDYRTEPEPPLTGKDTAWAEELLRTAGKRPITP